MRRTALALVAFAICCLALPEGVSAEATRAQVLPAATSSTLSTGNGASCVWTFSGWDGLSFTWNTTTRQVKAKCYWWGSAPYTGFFPTTSTADPVCVPGANMSVPAPNGSTDVAWSAAPSGTSSFVWSNCSTTLYSSVYKYVEFQFDLKRWSGVTKVQGAAGDSVAGPCFSAAPCPSIGSAGYGIPSFIDTDGGSWPTTGTAPTPKAQQWVSATAFATDVPPYRGGASYVGEACAGYTLTASPATGLIAPGASVSITASWDTGLGLKALDAQVGSGQPWQSVQVAGGLYGSPSATVTKSVKNLSKYSVAVSMIRMRCTRSDNSIGYAYIGLTGTWDGDNNATVSACDTASLIWPEWKTYAAGATLDFTVDYPGLPTLPTILSVEYFNFDYLNASVPAYSSVTWNVVSGFPMSAGSRKNFSTTTGWAGPPNQFVFRCQDSLGYHYSKSWSASYYFGTIVTPVDPSCFDGVDLGINPKSWVPGALGAFWCGVKSAFVPSTDSWDSTVDAWQDSSLSDLAIPINAVADGIGSLGSVTNGCAGDVTNLPIGDGSSVPVHMLDACEGPAATARGVSWWGSRIVAIIGLAFAMFRLSERVAMGWSNLSWNPTPEAQQESKS